MRQLNLLFALMFGVLITHSAHANDDATLVIGTWEATSDQPGTPWGYAVVQVTFSADGSGVEFTRIDGTETSYDFDWHIAPGTPSGSVTITLGGEDYSIPLQVLDRDTIRISSPASADLPEHPMATFTRIGEPETAAANAPVGGSDEGVPFTQATVGMTAEYSNGMTMVVTKVTGDGGMIVTESHPEWGRTETQYAYGLDWVSSTWFDDDGTVNRSTYDFDITHVEQAWPLTPGYETSYVSTELVESEAPRSLPVWLRVLDTRPYDGPGGPAQAGVAEVEIDLGNDERVIYEYWYIPGFALPVRLEITILYPGGSEILDEAELVGFTYAN